MNYLRRTTTVTAVRFDGSRASALEAASRLPGCVTRSVGHDDVLVVRDANGPMPVRAGEWITQDLVTGAIRIWSDAEFQERHEPGSIQCGLEA